MDEPSQARVRWQDELYDLLRRNNITQFAYVPDAGHRILIDRSLADSNVHSVALTTEEEGVALLAGTDLGGARGVRRFRDQGDAYDQRRKGAGGRGSKRTAPPLCCCG